MAAANHRDAAQEELHPRNLIPELCRLFYGLGWVTGTGGGISLKIGNEIYIAPSGVQKERIQPEDIFVCDMNEQDISGPPPHKKLKKSQCMPLFMNAYRMRGAGAVIHTHSKAAVMATLLYPGSEFSITHQEMIKGIQKCTSGGYYRYFSMFEKRAMMIHWWFPLLRICQKRRISRKGWHVHWKNTQTLLLYWSDVTEFTCGGKHGKKPKQCVSVTITCLISQCR